MEECQQASTSQKYSIFFFRSQQKLDLVSGSPTPVLDMKVRQGVERYLVNLEDKINNHINEKVSSRAVH